MPPNDCEGPLIRTYLIKQHGAKWYACDGRGDDRLIPEETARALIAARGWEVRTYYYEPPQRTYGPPCDPPRTCRMRELEDRWRRGIDHD